MNPTRIFFLVSLFLIVLTPLYNTSNAQNIDNSIFWKVSGNGLEKPSYIFGTISFVPKKSFKIPKEVKEAMEECEIFATKMVHNQYTINEFNKAARIDDDGMINDYLNEDELNKLRILMLRKLGVKENAYHDDYSRLQPIILVTSTTALYLEKNIIYVESELAKLAKQENLQFVGLGTVEEEIKAFDQFPIEDQVEALQFTVVNFNEHISDYYKLVGYYSDEQDLQKVKDETLKATNESQVFRVVYYDARNVSWIPVIDQYMQRKPTFIAIGAAHLPGENGLIRLLREEGYKIEPIRVLD